MVKFGPSGNDINFYNEGYKHTYDVFKWLKDMDLQLYEYSFGKGINLSDETAIKIGEKAKENNIEISVHAPYYINLANNDAEALKKNIGYIINSLKKLQLMGGRKCIVHLASCGKLEREEALKNVKNNLLYVIENIYNEGLDNFFVCPETMGKYMQIGNVDEIVDFCTLDKILIPTFDFGHINCLMQGKLDSEEEYKKILDLTKEKLGDYKTNNLHVHFSQIEYGVKGELRHLTLDNGKFGPPFEPLAEVIKLLNLSDVTIISESKEIMAIDAKKLSNIFYCK